MISGPDFKKFVEELRNTNSKNDKIKILKAHPEQQEALLYTYHPFWKYGVSKANCKKLSHIQVGKKYQVFHTLLDDLAYRRITGHEAIGSVNQYMNMIHPEIREVFWCVLEKDLKCGIDIKTINSAFKGLIPEFSVALANKYDEKKHSKLLNDEKSEWYISRKLDGVRVIAILRNPDDIKFFSRTGHEFTTLDKVKEALKKDVDFFQPIIFDGELCIVDENGNEDFKKAVSMIRRKDFTIQKPVFKIFDTMPLGLFMKPIENSILTFGQRYKNLLEYIPKNHPVLHVVEQVRLTDYSFAAMLERSKQEGWEGLMLRKDAPYKNKRSNDLLKVKSFHDGEYKVVDIETTRKPMLKNGKMVPTDCCGAIIIEHKGNKVGVGTGMSDEQRVEWFKNPSLILGKTVLIAYFEESQDKDGNISLRFPALKHVYDGARDV